MRFILTIHDLSFLFFPEYFSLKQRFWHALASPRHLCERANIILTPSEQTKRDLIAAFPFTEKAVHVAPPGITLPPSYHQRAIQSRGKYILFLGTIESRKNVDGLIEAFLYWQKSSPLEAGYSLILAGAIGRGGKQFVRKYAGNQSIRFLGYVGEEEKTSLYQQASVFVYPSFYEGFGLPVLEALSLGVPVVTSNRSSLPEAAGRAAYLADPHNIADIAHGIDLFVGDGEFRNRCRKLGMEHASKFSWENTARIFFFLLFSF